MRLDSLGKAFEIALAKEFGMSTGIVGYSESEEQRIINQRVRALDKQAKLRRRYQAKPDPDALPAGMVKYAVTHLCGHERSVVLREGFTSEDLSEAYSGVDCPECAAAKHAAYEKAFADKWGLNF